MEHLVGVKQNSKTLIDVVYDIDYVFNQLKCKVRDKNKKKTVRISQRCKHFII